MPGFDGTGPMGKGVMTGRGRGYCVVNLNGGVDLFAGRRLSGGGRGYCNCFAADAVPGKMLTQRWLRSFRGFGRAVSSKFELDILKDQEKCLKSELEAIQAKVKALESEPAE